MSPHLPPTRRAFLKYAAGTAGLVLAAGMVDRFATEDSPILVNHVGYPTQSAKFCLKAGIDPLPFSVVDAVTGAIVFKGVMQPQPDDLGPYVAGDFGELRQPGTYAVLAGGRRSLAFNVNAVAYSTAIQQSISYFSKQRCGNSTTGYNAPCHTDDGVRTDNHQHQDVVGGWHDACDLRKWVDSTIYGMLGLTRIIDLMPNSSSTATILDELRWGNRYFLKMQEPAGYVMNYCGGDDGNFFTDNIIGTSDDRKIHVESTGLTAQFNFVTAQANLARQIAPTDLHYAKDCLTAATNCMTWVINNRSITPATTLGAGIVALVALDKARPELHYRDEAASYARHLLKLQVVPAAGQTLPISGFFLSDTGSTQPAREIQDGNTPLAALCSLLEHMPTNPDAALWRNALKLHAHYLLTMSGKSAFQTIPFGLYAGANPGGNRRMGSYWYRFFMKTEGEYADAPTWWVGINGHLASHGIGLSRAAVLLNDGRFADLAQRQLDWILGNNPFNASTVIGAGSNQPAVFKPGAFSPPTPLIPGGVMNGVGADANDQARLYSGQWQTCEYWTPMVGQTMSLMAQLQA